MTGGLLRRAKKVIRRPGSSSDTVSRVVESSSIPVHQESQEEQNSETHVPPRESFHATGQPEAGQDEGVWLIDGQGSVVKRRGRTTCADIQRLPPGTRVVIEANDNGVPCNIPESILLGSYLGVVARDPVLAPINFTDWRNKGMEPFKKRMLDEIESKFEIPKHIRSWVLKSLGVKWRNHKSNLKAEHWNDRPIQEIFESVPVGIDASQWCQLVTHWSLPKNQERASKNSENAKKQTCPHTMGRVSSVRRQKETAIQDRLQLWKINRLHKDGTWTSEDAKNRWEHACELLAQENLSPEDGNLEANERVFQEIMGPEHPGRVRTQGFGVTPNRYFPNSNTTVGESSGGSNFVRVARLEEEMQSVRSELRNVSTMRDEMQQFMNRFHMQFPPTSNSDMGDNNASNED